MKRILFICTGNYYRSRMAEEIFNSLAQDGGIQWEADSAGLRSDMSASPNEGPISKHAIACLSRGEYPILSRDRYPRSVRRRDFLISNLVIILNRIEHAPMMQDRFPAFAGRVHYWEVADIDELEPDIAFELIEKNIKRLVSDLQDTPV